MHKRKLFFEPSILSPLEAWHASHAHRWRHYTASITRTPTLVSEHTFAASPLVLGDGGPSERRFLAPIRRRSLPSGMRWSLPLLFAVGCVFGNLGPEEKLRDAVVGLNDEVRWNRIDLAAMRVDPGFRGQFRRTHADWHRRFELADVEIIDVQTAGTEHEQATSFVTFRWYDMSTMLLAETTVRQRWRRTIHGYLLMEEAVSDGNPRLLEIPARLRDEATEATAADDEATSGDPDEPQTLASLD